MIDRKSILKNLGANSIGTLINICIQIISVPIFIKYFGDELYGEWIVLFSFCTYFSMTNAGLNVVTLNEFCISYSSNKKERCKTLFNNNFFFIVSVAVLFSFIFILSLSFINISDILGFDKIVEYDSNFILVILVVQVFLKMISGLYNSIYRATNHEHKGVLLDNIFRLLENLFLMLGIIFIDILSLLIVIYLLPTIFLVLYKVVDSKKYYNIPINYKDFDYGEFRLLLKPAFTFLFLPVGNSMFSQGFTLIVNFVLGPAAVVVFNTSRTLVNFIKTGLGILNHSFWPQMSLSFGEKRYDVLRKTHSITQFFSLIFTVFSCVFLFFFSEWIYTFWTKNEIQYSKSLFFNLLLAMIAHSIWYTSSTILTATNKHSLFSKTYIVIAIIALTTGYLLLVNTKEIAFLPLAILLGDLMLIFICVRQSLILTQDNLFSMLNRMRTVFINKIMIFKI